MIKLVVHAPKGGVGKTTIATNIALYLARRQFKVWALDLAQGELMTKALTSTGIFIGEKGSKIETRELEELPESFPGERQFDYLVADTDDYFKIYSNLLDTKRRGWRVIVPILPTDINGLTRIPEETAKLMKGALLLLEKSQRPVLRIVANNCDRDQVQKQVSDITKALESHQIASLLSNVWVPHSDGPHPLYIDDPGFANAIERLLGSIGVGL